MRTGWRIGRAAIAVSMVLSGMPANAATDRNEAIQRILGDPADMAAPGCVAGVFRDGKTIHVGASGSADIATGRKLDGETLLYAASVAKQFTALAAAKLIESGKLGLYDEVHKWIPELPRYRAPITVQMLMNHSSGIRDSLELLNLAGVEDASRSNMEAALELLMAQKDTNFVPGTAYSYTNGGYLLLAEVIRRASGRPFHQYANEAVLKPLGMTRSFFVSGKPPPGLIANGYVPTDRGWRPSNQYPAFSGSGGLMLTIADMARYDHDIQVGHMVWTDKVAAIMLTAGTFSDGRTVTAPNFDGMPYAGGVVVGQRRGRSTVYHLGSFESFRTGYMRLPDRALGVAVLCNRSDGGSLQRIDRIIDAVEPGYLTPYDRYRPVVAAPYVVPPSRVMPQPGTYVSDDLKAEYRIAVQGDTVTATVTSAWPGHAEPKRMFAFFRDATGALRADTTGMVVDDDGRGFLIQTPRVTGIRFRPVAPR
ncbi:serine hydrolase domain-containing protein [Sphingomonas colocasiae]|uniref:Beta-lactamase family protein n=1 Tax=Sphingomonas colocasiae TaxID=1848973 RepID=A0ABS7PT73_9SPHN|nr:serine hydrolase domain-containing protein [Sphingomonas colocasiae]MBY8823875.1 beta-lactamase family protein [Sphingomonas colocasiae]